MLLESNRILAIRIRQFTYLGAANDDGSKLPNSCLNWYDDNLAASCGLLFWFSGTLIELRRSYVVVHLISELDYILGENSTFNDADIFYRL
jgi:hypothetical protein